MVKELTGIIIFDFSVSPSSPNYSGSPISNSITPSSGSGNLTIGNSNIYSPNSP